MADFSFRPVTRQDLPMLAGWLAQPEVAAWWRVPDHQIRLIREDLGHLVMRQVIACRADVPLGYAQYYPARHWPAPPFADLPEDSIAIDVFGAPAGRGQGGAWLRELGDLLLREASTLAIDPASDNHRAIRAYEKAGFAGDLVRTDSEGQPVRVMTRRR